jgi:acetyl esterase
MARFGALYRGEADPEDWRLSPMSASDVGSLPPTIVVAAEIDPLFSEGLAWIERLQTAGVEATHHTIPGTFHAFFGFVDALEESRTAQRLIAGHLARLTP